MTTLTNLRTLDRTVKKIILNHPLTSDDQQRFKKKLAELPDSKNVTSIEARLNQIYRDLITNSLSSMKYQLFYVANINHDHTWLAYPIEPTRVAKWRQSDSQKLLLFTQNAFMFDGLSVDETVAMALI